MSARADAAGDRWPGLIWGYDIVDGRLQPPVGDLVPAGAFRWLHVALSDQRALTWIAQLATLTPLVREVMLTTDEHPRALVDDNGTVACVIHDIGRGFSGEDEDVMRTLHFALMPQLMLTARHHPVRCADEVKRRLDLGLGPAGPAAALDLLIATNVGAMNARLLDLVSVVRAMEDALIDRDREPDGRALRRLRRDAMRVHRQASGLHGVLGRLEEDEALPAPLLPPVERLIQRVGGIAGDATGLIGQERQLREELAVRAAHRTNHNLYVLSIMTALMLPPTLVAGLFGMNTANMPFAAAPHGTLIAVLIALGSVAVAYALLRAIGFFRHGGPQ